MALSRRLFIGGLLTAATAPAIVTSKGFRQAICAPQGHIVPVQVNFQAHTGRLNVAEPAWQELRSADPAHREMLKRLLFCQRYGTQGPFKFDDIQRRPRLLVDLDFSRMEQRVLAARLGQLNTVVS